ncbi:hypothetical protein LXL04_011900 [Taraxacum kok-saghyz]
MKLKALTLRRSLRTDRKKKEDDGLYDSTFCDHRFTPSLPNLRSPCRLHLSPPPNDMFSSESGKMQVTQLTPFLVVATGDDPWSKFQKQNLPACQNSDGFLFNTIEELDKVDFTDLEFLKCLETRYGTSLRELQTLLISQESCYEPAACPVSLFMLFLLKNASYMSIQSFVDSGENGS